MNRSHRVGRTLRALARYRGELSEVAVLHANRSSDDPSWARSPEGAASAARARRALHILRELRLDPRSWGNFPAGDLP